MSFFKENTLFKIVNKKLLAFAVIVAISACVFQIDNIMTDLVSPVKSISISETTTPVHDSHIPQACNLAIQKYNNQIKNITDFLVSNNQGIFNLHKPLEITFYIPNFLAIWGDKIYIKNLTLLV